MRILQLSIFLVISNCFVLRATHIVGGEIYYDCLGNGNYLVTLKIYRDCLNGLAPFDMPAYLSIYSADNLATIYQSPNLYDIDSVAVPVIIDNPCLQAPPNICVTEGTYTFEVYLPPNNAGYHISYQRCCRNNTILNLVNPGDQGSTYTTFIPPSSLADCNNSPRFSNFPPVALCVGEELIFDHAAVDPDGDQIIYELCDALSGATPTEPMPQTPPPPPYNFVNYIGGYNASYPIASSPAISINPTTGELTLTPTTVGQFVVAVCANEYRNGQLINTHRRDFQFNVVNCTSNILASIPGQTDSCLGRIVTFENYSIGSQFYHWDFGVPTITYDTSNLELPTYTYSDTGTYTITLIANPGWPCADTATVDYYISEILEAEIPPLESQCLSGNSFDFTASGIFQSYSTFSWNFGSNASIQTSTLQNVNNVTFNQADTFLITLSIESDGCFSYDTVPIFVYENPKADFNTLPLTGCMPFAVNFFDSSLFAFGLTYRWNFGNDAISTEPSPTHVYTVPGVYSVELQVISNFGCIDTSNFYAPNIITVLPIPDASLIADTVVNSEFNPVFTFSNTSTNDIDCNLFFSNGNFSDTCDVTVLFESDTGFIQVRQVVVNNLGCEDEYILNVYVQPEFTLYIPNAFTPNGDPKNNIFKPQGLGFKDFYLEIYSRWGELIFRSREKNEGWDGTYRGENLEKCPLDVYAYKLMIRGVDLVDHVRFGKVTLIR